MCWIYQETMKTYEEVASLTSVLDGGEKWASLTGRFTPVGRGEIPHIYQIAHWVGPELVWLH
jgi:hypothetical protein